MGEKLIVGPLNKGLRNDRTAFVIDNDSFPTLTNAYQWRGRVKRKRGTANLTRLQRFFNSANSSYGSITSFNLVAGAGNLITAFGLETNSNIVPGSVSLTTGGNTYTDDLAGNLIGVPAGTGTINYATGAITIAGGGAGAVTLVSFLYYPDLPVMGLRDLTIINTEFPGTIAFNTTKAFNILTTSPYANYDVSFYKNPVADPVNLPGYVPKTNVTPVSWNGADYQQFWTTNYQNAFWATNGITSPFDPTKISMQFVGITAIAIVAAGPPAIVTITTSVNHGLVVGDFVFLNEIVGMTGINFQTGYATAVPAANQITVELPNATVGGAWASGGIVQYLTNRIDTTKDCLRWYDGDPTDGMINPPTLNGHLGWVNFCPPLSNLNYSIDETPLAQYYLVGAKMILPFKDRLLFFAPVIQTSSPNSQIFLQDTIIYSQNGTPFYTASFTGDPSLVTTVFHPILVPKNQTASPPAYWEDVTGYGGFVSAGVQQQIVTLGQNEDVIIVGFTRLETRLIGTGNDIVPFNFFIINTELGSESTFSAITLDKGIMAMGSRGFVITTQVESRRFDLEIPDEIFQVRRSDQGSQRACAQRDYINEWCYFTYPVNSINYRFPTQTLQYNYREDSWGMLIETYTTYGIFRKSTGYTWGTLPENIQTWNDWNVPWNSSASNLLQPEVIAGNQQGFVLERNTGTNEGYSLYIQNISGSTITSPDHCLNVGDYITVTGSLGITAINGIVLQVIGVTDNNNFVVDETFTGTYIGNGTIKRMYVPFIQTKQFPIAWSMSRKTRIGPQAYLFSKTPTSQITLNIYLSQDDTMPYNAGPVVPDSNVENGALIYSTILYTCPESTNIGLTPANVNLQTPTATSQSQIWHRINTSLIGDTVQIGFTLSDAQMRDPDFLNQFAEIELHSFILDVSPSQLLV